MPIIAKKSEGGFEPIPVGSHHGVCYGVIDLGTQPPNNPQFKASHRVLLMWETPDERIELNRDGVSQNLPRVISKEFPLSLGGQKKPTKTRTMLEAWRGRKFTDEELDGFDLKNVLGANCLLTVVHNVAGNGNTYANIEAVSPLMKSMQKKTPETGLTYFSLSDISGSSVVWPETIPEWIRKKVMASDEYVERFGGFGAPDHEAPPPTDDDQIPF